MYKYYIDGYNLLFRFFRRDEDFSEQRQQLIEALKIKGQQLGLEIVLVFDAQYQQNPPSRINYPCLQVLFTIFGESADERILSEIVREKNPRIVTVVTSDKKLAWFARRCEAHTESVETFAEWFGRRYKKYAERGKKVKTVKTSALLKPISKLRVSKKPEECLDYYLKEFEERDKQLSQPSEKPSRSKRSSSTAPKKAQKIESDFERWLRIFTSSQ